MRFSTPSCPWSAGTSRAYTGWGGLSIRKATAKFPANFPKPDPAGLVHENNPIDGHSD